VQLWNGVPGADIRRTILTRNAPIAADVHRAGLAVLTGGANRVTVTQNCLLHFIFIVPSEETHMQLLGPIVPSVLASTLALPSTINRHQGSLPSTTVIALDVAVIRNKGRFARQANTKR
jgi:hypothetical protein